MQTFTNAEGARLRAAFDAMVAGIDAAPELEEIASRPHRIHATPKRHGRRLVAATATVGLLVGVGLTALLASGDADPAAEPSGRGDVIVFFSADTSLGLLIQAADRVGAWDGVAIASPWTSADALDEFRELFADQPDLIAVTEQDPSILPASVRVWLEPGADASVIAELARREFPDAVQVVVAGDGSAGPVDASESTLPPLEILVTQVEPIDGYGDYSAYTYASVPWAEVTAAEIACMQDLGWPVHPMGDTGISWDAVPIGDNQAAQIDFARCMAGLQLPPYEGPTG